MAEIQKVPQAFRIKEYPYFAFYHKAIAAAATSTFYMQTPIYDFQHWAEPQNAPRPSIGAIDMPAIWCDIAITSIPGFPSDEIDYAVLGLWGSAFVPTTLGNEAACTYNLSTSYTGKLNLLSRINIEPDFVLDFYATRDRSGIVIPPFRIPVRFILITLAFKPNALTSQTDISFQLIFRTL